MIVSLLVNIFFEHIPGSFWVRSVDLWMYPFVMVLFLFCMLAGAELLHTQHEKKFKELEYQALQQYTRDVEEQSKEIQSFRHDYMNILLSLESYIHENNVEELKDFYYKKLVKTAEPMYKEAESELQQLRYIKDKEIKSILTVKIQKMISAGIQVRFEAVEEIEIINIDTVIMVRIIGILLDNAFEEVTTLDIKLVNVGLVKDENDIIFYVSNQCKEEYYDAKDMKRKGYTTKGNGRGTGLSNLANFSSKYKNIFIETKCENHRFTQIVTIGG
jgi:two-component system sensor histidine kinase AgrC